MRLQSCACVFFLGTAGVASAQACVPPIPFQYEFENGVTATLSAPNATDPCALSVAVNNGAGSTAAGFLHYRRLTPSTTARYAFRLDTSGISNMTVANQQVLLFSVSAPLVLSQESHLLDVRLAGGAANPNLRIVAATGAPFPFFHTFTPVALTQSSNVLRFEVTIGDGIAGTASYWINHDFSDAPDGTVIGTASSVFGGIIAAELGLSSPTPAFLANQADQTIVFDQIESSDDVLFFDDFSGGAQ